MKLTSCCSLSARKIPWKVLVLLLFGLLQLGCENGPSQTTLDVNAHWDADTETLHIDGKANSANQDVEIHDANTGDFLGKAIVNSDGSWSASTTASACDVHVELANGTAKVAVKNAPASCSTPASSLSQRVLTSNDIPTNVLVSANAEPLSTIPNAVIMSPPTDLTINVGETVQFSGTAIGTSIVPPISYYWNFGGAAPNSTVQNPGTVRFTQPGTYFVSLAVSDNLGIPDPSPAVRTITVNSGGSQQPISTIPQPTILSPIAVNGAISINVGESLFFSGMATDTTGSNAFTYEWNFAGGAANQFGSTPGNVSFFRAGSFRVTLNATNLLGIRSTTPATLLVNVGTGSGTNQAPSGEIVRPRNDVTINTGETLTFRASGRDPDNNTPLYYSWDFDGVAPDIFRSTSRDGGTITFNNPGIYRISMTVTDSLGTEDPIPALRTVTVLGSTTIPPPNGTLSNNIISPPVDTTIAPGQSVYFSGQVSPLSGAGPFRYFWTFDNAAPSSTLLTPGDITFPLPGQYIVQFFVMDFTGNVIGQPVTRVVTVTDPATATANLVAPRNGATFDVGQPVSLLGTVTNNTGFTALTYDWRIRKVGGSVVFQSSQRNPGSFTFTEPGDYRVRFKVSGIDPFGNPTVDSIARANITISDPLFINNTAIAYPAQDMFVTVGDIVNFQANPVFGSNIRYQWNFGGASTPSNQQTPPAVRFSLPGTYVVTLRITGTDFNGLQINQYGERLITVITPPGTTPFPPIPQPPIISPPVTGNATPEGFINTPSANRTVRVGTPVLFSGTGFDPTGAGPLTFIWSFGGAAPNIQSQNPGTVTFNRVGNYVVSLLVQNAYGQFDQTPATVVISVTP